MKKYSPKSLCLFFSFLSVFSTIVLADQFLKYKIRLSGGFYLCNKGIAFGINIHDGVFWLILSLFFPLFIFFLYKRRNWSLFFIISLSLFLSGSFSNIIDRMIFGCVLDYITIFQGFFPVFNLADVSITFGFFIFILSLGHLNHLKSE